jgi:hypothetical protein
MGMGGQRYAPAALPASKTLYPLYRRLSGPQGRYGRMRKVSPPQGFDPRSVQPVASPYTDLVIPAPKIPRYALMRRMERPHRLSEDMLKI